MTLKDKAAIVTGSANGIGLAIVERFARDGVKVILSDINEAKGAAEAKRLAAEGATVRFVRADVGSAADVAALVAETEDAFGAIDILVNNAGILRRQPTATVTDEEWDVVEGVNFRGARYCCQEVMEEMRERRWGRIVNIVSLVIKMIGRIDVASYATSKAALGALTKILAKDLGEFGVTVNAVLPGSIALTDFNNDVGYPKDTKLMPGMSIPVGRRGTPEDVAPTVAFLCSQKAGYITGEFIDVNGGLLMD